MLKISQVARHLNERLERYLCITLYIYLTAIIGIEVFRRYVLGDASLWGEETARFAFVYMTWIGAAWAVRVRLHIRIDAIYDFLSERVEGYLYIFSDIVMIIFGLYAVYWMIPVISTTLEFGRVVPALRVNQAFFQMAVPIGIGLFVFRATQSLYRDISDVRNGRPVYKGETLFGDS